jgi:hypothetical protein
MALRALGQVAGDLSEIEAILRSAKGCLPVMRQRHGMPKLFQCGGNAISAVQPGPAEILK